VTSYAASLAIDISLADTCDTFKLYQFFDEIIEKFTAAKTRKLCLLSYMITSKESHGSIFIFCYHFDHFLHFVSLVAAIRMYYRRLECSNTTVWCTVVIEIASRETIKFLTLSWLTISRVLTLILWRHIHMKLSDGSRNKFTRGSSQLTTPLYTQLTLGVCAPMTNGLGGGA